MPDHHQPCHARRACPLCLPAVSPALAEAQLQQRLTGGAPIRCLACGEAGTVVSIDPDSGEALVALRGSRVVHALADLVLLGDSGAV